MKDTPPVVAGHCLHLAVLLGHFAVFRPLRTLCLLRVRHALRLPLRSVPELLAAPTRQCGRGSSLNTLPWTPVSVLDLMVSQMAFALLSGLLPDLYDSALRPGVEIGALPIGTHRRHASSPCQAPFRLVPLT